MVRCCAVLLMVASVGCGSKPSDAPAMALHRVRGQVTVNGKAAAGAQVVLYPTGLTSLGVVTPRGEVADDGSFVITTYEYGDGAPEGTYRATVSWQPILNPNRSEPEYGPEQLPAKYQHPETSGFEFEVKPDENELPVIAIATR